MFYKRLMLVKPSHASKKLQIVAIVHKVHVFQEQTTFRWSSRVDDATEATKCLLARVKRKASLKSCRFRAW